MAVISSGVMGSEYRLKKGGEGLGLFREWGVLSFPIIKVRSRKGYIDQEWTISWMCSRRRSGFSGWENWCRLGLGVTESGPEPGTDWGNPGRRRGGRGQGGGRLLSQGSGRRWRET